MTIAEVAAVTGVSQADVRAWIKAESITTVGMGSQQVVRVADVMEHFGKKGPTKVTLSDEAIARARETR